MTPAPGSRRASQAFGPRRPRACAGARVLLWSRAVTARLLVVLALPWLAGGCPNYGPEDEIFLIRNPDADTQALIDACRDHARPDCLPLCEKLTGWTANEIAHCELHPDRDGYIQVHVGSCPGAGCE